MIREPNRSYKVNYDLVQRKPRFVQFNQKLHKDIMKCEDNGLEKRDKLWDRLLKRADDEKAAEEKEFADACKAVGLQWVNLD